MAKDYETPDVRQLGDLDHPQRGFPASRKQDFRIYFDAAVHTELLRHVGEDTSVEVGGVLVGQWLRDDDGPFVAVSHFIRCESPESKPAELTFTHDAWTTIHQEMDTRYCDLSIVGWYHSHPDFGIFLSERDSFIQQHFFSGPGQIAHVVDPVRKTEGAFIWRDGRPTLCEQYWIGDRIGTHLTDSQDRQPAGMVSSAAETVATPVATPPASTADSLRTLLLCAAMLLIGYLTARGIGAWERQRLIEGTVAHYGIWKGLRPGLDEALQVVDAELKDASSELRDVASRVEPAPKEPAPKKDTDAEGEEEEETKQISDLQLRLRRTRLLIDRIRGTYCLTPEEAKVVARIVAGKTAKLRQAKPQKTGDSGNVDNQKPATGKE